MIERPIERTDVPLRAVLDTSVLLSEHRHWLWLLAQQGYYEGVWSTFIVGEMVRIRVALAIKHGQELRLYRERINVLIHRFSAVLSAAAYSPVLADPRLVGALHDNDDLPGRHTQIQGSWVPRRCLPNSANWFPDGRRLSCRRLRVAPVLQLAV